MLCIRFKIRLKLNERVWVATTSSSHFNPKNMKYVNHTHAFGYTCSDQRLIFQQKMKLFFQKKLEPVLYLKNRRFWTTIKY